MKGDSLQKKYYRISEVAEILNLPASTLRYWEQRFNILKPRRGGTGTTRLYTPADIDKLRMIRYLLHERGLKIEAAQEQIARGASTVERRRSALERLREVRSQLQNLLDGLNQLPERATKE